MNEQSRQERDRYGRPQAADAEGTAGRGAEGPGFREGAGRLFETRQNPYGPEREEALEQLPKAERPKNSGVAIGSGVTVFVAILLAIALLPFFFISAVVAAPIAVVVAVAAGIWAWSRRGRPKGT